MQPPLKAMTVYDQSSSMLLWVADDRLAFRRIKSAHKAADTLSEWPHAFYMYSRLYV